LNAKNKRLWLPSAYSSAAFGELFGQPAVEWSAADFKMVRKAAQRCGKLARKEKLKGGVKAMRKLQSSLTKHLGSVLGSVRLNRPKLDKSLEKLLGEAPSRDLLKSLGLLRKVGPGGELAVEYRQALRTVSGVPGMQAPIVLAALRGLPDDATESIREPVEKRLDEIRRPWLPSFKPRSKRRRARSKGSKL
jgi:hypothetical protein